MKAVSLSSAAERLRTQGDGWAELRGKVKESAGGRRAAGFSPTGHRGTASPPTLPPSLRLHGPPGGAGGRLSARHGGVSGAEPPCSRPPRRRQPSAAPLRSAPALLPAAASRAGDEDAAPAAAAPAAPPVSPALRAGVGLQPGRGEADGVQRAARQLLRVLGGLLHPRPQHVSAGAGGGRAAGVNPGAGAAGRQPPVPRRRRAPRSAGDSRACSAGSASWWELPEPTPRSRTSWKEERCTTAAGRPRAAGRSPSITRVSALRGRVRAPSGRSDRCSRRRCAAGRDGAPREPLLAQLLADSEGSPLEQLGLDAGWFRLSVSTS